MLIWLGWRLLLAWCSRTVQVDRPRFPGGELLIWRCPPVCYLCGMEELTNSHFLIQACVARWPISRSKVTSLPKFISLFIHNSQYLLWSTSPPVWGSCRAVSCSLGKSLHSSSTHQWIWLFSFSLLAWHHAWRHQVPITGVLLPK